MSCVGVKFARDVHTVPPFWAASSSIRFLWLFCTTMFWAASILVARPSHMDFSSRICSWISALLGPEALNLRGNLEEVDGNCWLPGAKVWPTQLCTGRHGSLEMVTNLPRLA